MVALRAACVELLAEMEARLDFAEELPELDTDSIQAQIVGMQSRLEAALRTARRGRLLRGGVQARPDTSNQSQAVKAVYVSAACAGQTLA